MKKVISFIFLILLLLGVGFSDDNGEVVYSVSKTSLPTSLSSDINKDSIGYYTIKDSGNSFNVYFNEGYCNNDLNCYTNLNDAKTAANLGYIGTRDFNNFKKDMDEGNIDSYSQEQIQTYFDAGYKVSEATQSKYISYLETPTENFKPEDYIRSGDINEDQTFNQLSVAEKVKVYDYLESIKGSLTGVDKINYDNLLKSKSAAESMLKSLSDDEIIQLALETGATASDIIATKQGLNKDKCDSWYCSFLIETNDNLYDITKETSQETANELKTTEGSDLFNQKSFLDYFKKDESTSSSSEIYDYNEKLKTNVLKSISDYKSFDGISVCDDMSSDECSNAIDEYHCEDSACEEAKKVYDVRKQTYEDNKAVELNTFGEIMNILSYKGDTGANQAAKLIFGDSGSSFDVPDFLTDSMESTICKDKIEGYLDKDFANENENNIGGITKFGSDKNNIEVVYDLRASQTGLTPDNKINIHYSYYLNLGSSGQFLISVNFINSKGDLEKVWLFENPKNLSSEIKNTGFYDLNVSNGIEINTLKLKLRAKNDGLDIISPIEIPILPASIDSYTGLGNTEGNEIAKTEITYSPTMPTADSWD